MQRPAPSAARRDVLLTLMVVGRVGTASSSAAVAGLLLLMLGLLVVRCCGRRVRSLHEVDYLRQCIIAHIFNFVIFNSKSISFIL